MKLTLLLIALSICLSVSAQTNKDTSKAPPHFNTTAVSIIATQHDSDLISKYYAQNFIYDPNNRYTYLFVNGHVEFANKKNSYLIVVRDTSSMSIKYADSIFVIHISPKFVTKINDSTYTFKQLK